MAASIQIIRSELRRSLHGPAWHGPAVLEVLSGVSAAAASARPVAGAHSIAGIALHVLAWIEEVTRRMDTNDAALPARGDWPAVPHLTEAGWRDIVASIATAGAALDAAVARFPDARLSEKVGGEALDPPTGSGVPYGVMLHGLAQHNAYHGGQMSLLKNYASALAGGSTPAQRL